MKQFMLVLLVALSALVAGGAAAAGDGNAVGAAYSISNAASGNSLLVYTRSSSGSLTPVGASRPAAWAAVMASRRRARSP